MMRASRSHECADPRCKGGRKRVPDLFFFLNVATGSRFSWGFLFLLFFSPLPFFLFVSCFALVSDTSLFPLSLLQNRPQPINPLLASPLARFNI